MTAELNNPQEIPQSVEQPKVPEWKVRTPAYTRETLPRKASIYLESNLTLNEIPDLDPDVCMCASPSNQKEFISYEVRSDKLRIVAKNLPGYGCKNCDVKQFHSETLNSFESAAAVQFRTFGDEITAKRIEDRVALYEDAIRRFPDRF